MEPFELTYINKDRAARQLSRLVSDWSMSGAKMDIVSAGFVYDVMTAIGYSDQEIETIFPEIHEFINGLEPCISK